MSRIPSKSRTLAVIGGLAVSLAGGSLCAWLKTPLPWMIGPLTALAVFQFGGASLEAPPVVREVSSFALFFLALGFAAIGAGMLSAAVLARLGRVDYRPTVVSFDGPGLATLLAAGLLAGLGARRLRVPNRFMIGPLAAGVAITASDVSLSSMPAPLSNGAQLLLAWSLGTQFRQSFLREAPRFMVAQLAAVALILAASVVIGTALAWLSGAYLGSALLAAAPGAIAEMSITAKVLRVGVPFVTAAHVMRYLVVVVFSGPAFRLLVARRRPGTPG